jgi:5-formyltetrahydrofolate cyclo-ligase
MSDAAVGPTKPALRAAAVARRDALTPASRASASAAIARRAGVVLAAAQPKAIGTYRAFGSEADTDGIVRDSAARGVAVGLATMLDRDVMVFRRYAPGDSLVPDAYRILAPLPSAPTVEPDVLIVPVSAFDRRGMRLGKGHGVYDRAIAALRARGRAPLLVGIAFSVQEVAAIPAEAHDARLDWLVTENQALEFP